MYRREHSLADFLPPTGYHAPMPQSIPQGLNRDHVLKALVDLDAGIDHPFGRPTGYELVHEGRRYAPKAVVGIAHRHLTGEILHPSKFSGGEAPGQANYELRRSGFKVEAQPDDQVEPPTVWSDEEVGLLIADYFDMLELDLLGRDYSKADHNRQLREGLTGRSRPSVEFTVKADADGKLPAGAITLFEESGPDRAVYSAQICGEIPKEKTVKDRGKVMVWVYVSANHWLDCAYLSTAAADFVVANRERLSGVKRPRKQAGDYSARPQPGASPYASRPVAGVM